MLKSVKSSSKRRGGGAALGDEGELQVAVLGEDQQQQLGLRKSSNSWG